VTAVERSKRQWLSSLPLSDVIYFEVLARDVIEASRDPVAYVPVKDTNAGSIGVCAPCEADAHEKVREQACAEQQRLEREAADVAREQSNSVWNARQLMWREKRLVPSGYRARAFGKRAADGADTAALGKRRASAFRKRKKGS
jgi:hypothetical protein